ncbi:MAG: alpha-ribazole phosphatase [Actinobacteria bacterium RBG_16_64_13]|nr:MAG: alpha-ribazole phosphatase [Actinobacteria bacterium RBG_16_64_13]
MRTTHIYLVRHTETDLPDGSKRFVGQADLPLSAEGVVQAHRLAERLGAISFGAVYSSDLRRCMTTAQIIGEKSGVGAYGEGDLRIQPDPRLREIDTGLWEGLTFDEARVRYPAECAQRERDVVGFRFPGGESFRDLRRRAMPSFLEIVGQRGAKVLVVGHRGVNRILLCEALGLPLDKMFSINQDYGSLSLIRAIVRSDGTRAWEVTMLPGLDSAPDPDPNEAS